MRKRKQYCPETLVYRVLVVRERVPYVRLLWSKTRKREASVHLRRVAIDAATGGHFVLIRGSSLSVEWQRIQKEGFVSGTLRNIQ